MPMWEGIQCVILILMAKDTGSRVTLEHFVNYLSAY